MTEVCRWIALAIALTHPYGSDFVRVSITSILSQSELRATNPFLYVLAHPNPSTGHLKIIVYGLLSIKTESVVLRLLDIQGHVLQNIYAESGVNLNTWQTSLDLQHLPPGTYLIQLRSGSTIKTTKWIKI
jgi:hypothetical protein